jgi:hypothetical protein
MSEGGVGVPQLKFRFVGIDPEDELELATIYEKEFFNMREVIFSLAIVFSSPALAQELEFGHNGFHIYPERHHHRSHIPNYYCEELREACIYKQEFGEEGEGNCRRYRHVCRGSW